MSYLSTSTPSPTTSLDATRSPLALLTALLAGGGSLRVGLPLLLLLVLLLGSGAGSSGLAGKLNANLPLLNLVTAELFNGAVGLLLGGEVDEGVTDGATGAGIGGDRSGLTGTHEYVRYTGSQQRW